MSNPDQLISVLTIVAVFLIILIFTLIGVWFFIVAKQKKNDGEKSEKNEATPSPNATYNLQSIMDFMEFEKVEDKPSKSFVVIKALTTTSNFWPL